jgi:hypothetical protein
MATPNRSSLKNRNVSAAAGVDVHIAAPVTIGGEAFTPPELKAVFAAHSAALDAADSMRKQWADQLLVVDATGARASAAHRYLRSYLVGQFGDAAHAILNDFGMTRRSRGGRRR